ARRRCVPPRPDRRNAQPAPPRLALAAPAAGAAAHCGCPGREYALPPQCGLTDHFSALAALLPLPITLAGIYASLRPPPFCRGVAVASDASGRCVAGRFAGARDAARRALCGATRWEQEMAEFTYDHMHLRSPNPEATAAFYERMFGAEIIRSTQQGKPRID